MFGILKIKIIYKHIHPRFSWKVKWRYPDTPCQNSREVKCMSKFFST